MARTIKDFVSALPSERKNRIKKRSNELIQECFALQELRKALLFTQEQIAQEMNMGQGNLSNLEKRTDLMLSTLRRYVEAMGGSLKLIAEFPERPPVEIIGFRDALRDLSDHHTK